MNTHAHNGMQEMRVIYTGGVAIAMRPGSEAFLAKHKGELCGENGDATEAHTSGKGRATNCYIARVGVS